MSDSVAVGSVVGQEPAPLDLDAIEQWITKRLGTDGARSNHSHCACYRADGLPDDSVEGAVEALVAEVWRLRGVGREDPATPAESWPDGMEMIHQLWEAVHGSRSSAQPRPPKEVWEELLAEVRGEQPDPWASMPYFVKNADGTIRASWPDPLQSFYPVSVELLKQWVDDKNELTRLQNAKTERA